MRRYDDAGGFYQTAQSKIQASSKSASARHFKCKHNCCFTTPTITDRWTRVCATTQLRTRVCAPRGNNLSSPSQPILRTFVFLWRANMPRLQSQQISRASSNFLLSFSESIPGLTASISGLSRKKDFTYLTCGPAERHARQSGTNRMKARPPLQDDARSLCALQKTLIYQGCAGHFVCRYLKQT